MVRTDALRLALPVYNAPFQRPRFRFRRRVAALPHTLTHLPRQAAPIFLFRSLSINYAVFIGFVFSDIVSFF